MRCRTLTSGRSIFLHVSLECILSAQNSASVLLTDPFIVLSVCVRVREDVCVCVYRYRGGGVQQRILGQLARGVEYSYCISAEGQGYPHEHHEYDTKQCAGEVPVILELWEMRSTPSLPLLAGPLRSVVVASDMVLSMGQIELFELP